MLTTVISTSDGVTPPIISVRDREHWVELLRAEINRVDADEAAERRCLAHGHAVIDALVREFAAALTEITVVTIRIWLRDHVEVWLEADDFDDVLEITETVWRHHLGSLAVVARGEIPAFVDAATGEEIGTADDLEVWFELLVPDIVARFSDARAVLESL
jgi:hypothetical protein